MGGDILRQCHAFECFNDHFALDPERLDLYKLSRDYYRSVKQEEELRERSQLNHRKVNERRTPIDLDNQTDSLLTLCLYLTHDCNLNCPYCFDSESRKKHGRQRLDVSDAMMYIEAASRRARTLEIWFFGGEPLLEFDLIKEIVARCEDLRTSDGVPSIRYGITTNGTLIIDEKLDFLERHHFAVTVSIDDPLDSSEARTHSQKGAESLTGLRKILKKQSSLASVATRTTVIDNIDLMRDMFWALRRMGVKTIVLSPAFNDRNEGQITEEEARAWARQLRRIVFEVVCQEGPEAIGALPQISKYFFNFEYKMPRSHTCMAGKTLYAIDVTGECYRCQRYLSHGTGRVEPFDDTVYANIQIGCNRCWAYMLCSGGICAFHRETWLTEDNFEPACILTRSMIELSAWAYWKYRNHLEMIANQPSPFKKNYIPQF